jgi:hypothetical protein
VSLKEGGVFRLGMAALRVSMEVMQMRGVRYQLLLILLACAVLLAPLGNQLIAQESRGSIVGKVSDPTGAVVPGATVTVVSKTMGTKVAVSTNEAGAYQASFLLPGGYQITGEREGFKKSVRDVEVQVNSRLEINIVLEVGGSTESVTVTAESPLLNTASASIGDIIDQRRVSELPLAHGQPFALAGLAAGVSFNANAATLNRPFEPTHIAGYAMDGVRSNRSDITIDGIPSTATSGPGSVISSYVPPADIVQEFRVQTATFDAQFGNTEGGVINMSIKSGTNALHGTALYAKWVPSLTAGDWFNNRAGKKSPDFVYNRWGGTAGGPLWLPKIYDGRNKTFWMWGYEAIHETRPRNNCGSTCAVPTDAEWGGDFSRQLAYKAALQIYNPFSATTTGNGIVTRSPFAGNTIPTSMITAQAKALRKYWPVTPATASLGNPDDSNNNNDPSLLEPVTYYTHTIRVDQNVSEKQRIFARFSFYKRDSNYNNYLGSIATGEFFQFVSKNAVIDDVYTLSPTMVLNVKYGYNRFIRASNSNPGSYNMDLTTLGFSSAYQTQVTQVQATRFPGINMQGYTATDHADFVRPIDTHSFAATVTKMKGSHSIRAGMELRVYRENQLNFGNDGVGRFTFNGAYTSAASNASPPNPAMGLSVAALLLGIPSGTITRLASYAEQSPAWGFFVQDDWKVSRKLTLNLGLREEFEQPLTERYNRTLSGFDPNFVQAFEAQAQTAYGAIALKEKAASQFTTRGGVLFAGVNGQERGLYSTPKVNLAPRFGFAFQLTDRTVMRGGYGIFLGFLGQRQKVVQQAGYSAATTITASNDNGLTFATTLANPFPGGVNTPVGPGEGGATSLNQNITFFNPNPLTPTNQRWQFSLQREFAAGFVVDAAYVGSRGSRMEITRDLNTLPRQFLSTGAFRDDTWRTYLVGTVANPFKGLLKGTAANNSLNTSSTIARSQLLRTYPEFGQVNTTTNQGYSWYHSLQVSVQKRFSKGYMVAGTYTFSKFMQATEYLNASDPMPIETISDMDTPHRVTVSPIWELPFGRGRKFGAGANSVVSTIISGWQLQGIYTFQSARPIPFSNNMFFGDFSKLRLPVSEQTVDHWFANTAAAGWVTTAAQVIDTNTQLRTFPLRFGFIRSDPLNNFDISVLKNTRVAEGKNVQLRFEAINAMNHPNFAAPVGTATDSNFGKVTAIQNYTRRLQMTARFVF